MAVLFGSGYVFRRLVALSWWSPLSPINHHHRPGSCTQNDMLDTNYYLWSKHLCPPCEVLLCLLPDLQLKTTLRFNCLSKLVSAIRSLLYTGIVPVLTTSGYKINNFPICKKENFSPSSPRLNRDKYR